MNDTSANDISEYVKAGDISKARELHLQVARTSAKWSGKAGVCGVKKAMDRYGFRGELPELPFTRQNTIYSMLLKPLWHMPFGFNYAHSCERDYVAKRSRPVRAYRRRYALFLRIPVYDLLCFPAQLCHMPEVTFGDVLPCADPGTSYRKYCR